MQTQIPAQNSKVDDIEPHLLAGGPFHRLLTKTGLGRTGSQGVRIRIAAFVMSTYIPILALCLWQGVAFGNATRVPFCYDISEAARFLFVGPLLIASEVLLEPWIAQVIRYVSENLVDEQQSGTFQSTVSRVLRYRDSSVAEFLLLVGTFIWFSIEATAVAPMLASSWQNLPDSTVHSAGWYFYSYFAKPLIRFLWLRWLWRYLLWTALLWRVSRLNLRLSATHPDGYGGLGFVANGHSKFSVLAFAFGAQAASILGEQILLGNKVLMDFRYDIVGFVLIVLVIFLTPLLVFTGKLFEAKRQGLFEYGALANTYVTDFRKRWIAGEHRDNEFLGTSDIQSLADIGNSYLFVRNMKTCLIGKDNLTSFAGATLLPFTPLILTIYPFDELLNHLLKSLV